MQSFLVCHEHQDLSDQKAGQGCGFFGGGGGGLPSYTGLIKTGAGAQLPQEKCFSKAHLYLLNIIENDESSVFKDQRCFCVCFLVRPHLFMHLLFLSSHPFISSVTH